jgi:hypothetical protein
MAYNKRNQLRRIVDIQNITLEYKQKGCSQEWIFQKLIHPSYTISRTTFYRYLNTPAKAELKRK